MTGVTDPSLEVRSDEARPEALRRALSARQISMLAIGGAIGTGLFLGSSLALSLAGRTVVIAYVIGALITLVMIYAAMEMATAHPDVNGFGGLAHRYLGPLAGFVQRWLYWAVAAVTMGAEAVAVGVYVRYWWPSVSLWVPVTACALAVVAANLVSVRLFGTFEYWLSMIKVSAIVAFLLLGFVYLTVGLPERPSPGLSAWTSPAPLLPHGVNGFGVALIVVMFGYGGMEALALTATESTDPRRNLPRAARWTIYRLALFYVLSIAVIVSISAAGAAPTGELSASPFVRLFDWMGLPAAAAVMNFVVLTAALSALNTLLYVAVRTLYSLGRDGQAPAFTTRLSGRGVPAYAVLLSAVGLGLAATITIVSPDTAFAKLLGIASFGGLATWALICLTHLAFRARTPHDTVAAPIRLPGAPYTTVVTILALVGMIVSMLFVPMFRDAWLVGVPFLLLILAAYPLVRRHRQRVSSR
jgi:L-asparagine transporter-like permease